MVVVVGDVNATMACALVAAKLNIPCAHLEAGLRSFDRTMPEEINRLVTDAVANLLWTPSADADENLIREGVATEKLLRVGNIMIDSLELLRPRIEKAGSCERLGLKCGEYGVVTLHRPSNVDSEENLRRLVQMLKDTAGHIKLVFPVHPRTRKKLNEIKLLEALELDSRIVTCEPLSYIQFMNLVLGARLVITDSGGLQEETTYLGIPCLTLRENTERPITVSMGTNRLTTPEKVASDVQAILWEGQNLKRPTPEYWDGNTAGRVVESIKEFLGVKPAKARAKNAKVAATEAAN